LNHYSSTPSLRLEKSIDNIDSQYMDIKLIFSVQSAKFYAKTQIIADKWLKRLKRNKVT